MADELGSPSLTRAEYLIVNAVVNAALAAETAYRETNEERELPTATIAKIRATVIEQVSTSALQALLLLLGKIKTDRWTVVYYDDSTLPATTRQLGPFTTENAAMVDAKRAQANEEFDINDTDVFLVGPDMLLRPLAIADVVDAD